MRPQFYYIKVGCKGVFVTRTCFRDEPFSTIATENTQRLEILDTLYICGNYALHYILTITTGETIFNADLTKLLSGKATCLLFVSPLTSISGNLQRMIASSS